MKAPVVDNKSSTINKQSKPFFDKKENNILDNEGAYQRPFFDNSNVKFSRIKSSNNENLNATRNKSSQNTSLKESTPDIQMANECGVGHHRIWGGFQINGDCNFVIAVRADLNRINSTTIGNRLLSWVTRNRSGVFSSLLRIESSSAFGYIPQRIYYNPTGTISDNCAPGNWQNVPN